MLHIGYMLFICPMLTYYILTCLMHTCFYIACLYTTCLYTTCFYIVSGSSLPDSFPSPVVAGTSFVPAQLPDGQPADNGLLGRDRKNIVVWTLNDNAVAVSAYFNRFCQYDSFLIYAGSEQDLIAVVGSTDRFGEGGIAGKKALFNFYLIHVATILSAN